MRSWIIAAALALAAAPAMAQMAVPAPTPGDIAVRVAADQNGQSVSVTQGDGLAIELQSTPSVGSSWRVASKPDFLADPEQVSGPTTAGTRPVLGAPRWQVFVFGVTGAGEGELVLEKVGRDRAVIETFRVNIVAS